MAWFFVFVFYLGEQGALWCMFPDEFNWGVYYWRFHNCGIYCILFLVKHDVGGGWFGTCLRVEFREVL